MNQIHPTAIIDPSVQLGSDNKIGPYAVISGDTTIGDGNWIGPHVVIGTPAQMRNGPHPITWANDLSSASIRIGNGNIFREFVTVHPGTITTTNIANDCYFMTQAHVPHDAQIEDAVTLSNSVQIGGHTIVQKGANIGLGSVVHQRSLIGSYAMIGMGSVVTKAILPFGMAYGSPARIRGGNVIGMKRAKVDDELISKIENALLIADLTKLRSLIPTEMNLFDIAAVSLKD